MTTKRTPINLETMKYERVKIETELTSTENEVLIVLHFGENALALQFDEPNKLIDFMAELMELAAAIWPENEALKMYLEDDGSIPNLPAPPKPSKLL